MSHNLAQGRWSRSEKPPNTVQAEILFTGQTPKGYTYTILKPGIAEDSTHWIQPYVRRQKWNQPEWTEITVHYSGKKQSRK
jgi:hypothetical protein